jgi:hypothetical protein
VQARKGTRTVTCSPPFRTSSVTKSIVFRTPKRQAGLRCAAGLIRRGFRLDSMRLLH